MADTIVALATPLGRSGIGVVRLSGTRSLEILRRLCDDPDFDPEPRKAYLRQLIHPLTGDLLDEALVTLFRGPNSFTGEDIVEISCHGSPVLLRQIVDIALSLHARLASPGEFTLRALGNGRLDLSEAEAIRDLIDAQTAAAARQAVRQLRGELSQQLQPLKDDLLNVIVILESALEFVEDDLPETQAEGIKRSLSSIGADVSRLAATFKAGHLIRDGLRVALAGRPNVGKSSLFNALLGSERAIVTDIAGTTRDHIHERFTIGDIPISLIDTAGLRETSDTVESIGVARSKAVMADADVVLVLIDASEPLLADDHAILDELRDIEVLAALNKIDKVSAAGVAEMREQLDRRGVRSVAISAKERIGLDALESALVEPFGAQEMTHAGFLVSDARHHDLLLHCEASITSAIQLMNDRVGEEIVLIDLHNALRYLGEITGETTTEDMLTRIFTTFCIGK